MISDDSSMITHSGVELQDSLRDRFISLGYAAPFMGQG